MFIVRFDAALLFHFQYYCSVVSILCMYMAVLPLFVAASPATTV